MRSNTEARDNGEHSSGCRGTVSGIVDDTYQHRAGVGRNRCLSARRAVWNAADRQEASAALGRVVGGGIAVIPVI
jgi:hypothetical protein